MKRFAVWSACLAAGLSAAQAEVVGGKAIDISEAPWTAKMSVGCTGSWLGGRWAITAKHCGSNISWIAAGITRRSETSDQSKRTPVRRRIAHPSADFQLLELAADVTAAKAKPIRLVTAREAADGLTAPGKAARLSGWGQLGQRASAPDSLHMLDHRIATKGATSTTYIYYGGAINGELQGSCFGDSGGPLAMKDAAGNWMQVGTVVGGSSVCGDADPDHYIRISNFESWLRQNMGNPTPVEMPAASEVMLASNRLRLPQGRQLEFIIRNPSGAVVAQSRGYFPAGEHALPAAGLAAGHYLASVRGEGILLNAAIRILP